MTRVAFFDLDRTLIDVNSGQLWLREEWRTGVLTVPVALKASYWFTRYALGDDTLRGALEEAASIYTGANEAEMAERVRVWFAREVAHRVRPGAREVVERHREAGDQLVLATSSSQFAAACAAELFSLDHALSTVVGSREGVLTGQVAELGFGRSKLALAQTWARGAGVDLADCAFYTDSFSDLSMLEAVGEPVVVHPDHRLRRAARKRGWPIVDWGRAAP